MRKPPRILSIALAFALALSLVALPAAPASAAYDSTKADKLNALGLFKGTDKGYDLDRAATRSEAAVMLIRLLGKETKAQAQYAAGALPCPFVDVPVWAQGQVTWLYENSLVNGVDSGIYGSDSTVTAQQYAALTLRALGYSESNGDFSYTNALRFAASIGLCTSEEANAYSSSFLRGDMVSMSYNALDLKMNHSSRTLYEKLKNDGVFSTHSSANASTGKLWLAQQYQGGGSETKWYVEPATNCSPVVTDIDGDGKNEIIYAGISVFCLDAKTGARKWKVKSGSDRNMNQDAVDYFGRTIVDLFVQDVDGDGSREIVVAHTNGNGTGCVSVYTADGYFKPGWPQHLNGPIYALTVADLDGNGKAEICAGLGTGDTSHTLFVFEPDGSLRNGWPQSCGNSIYSNAITAVDLNGDGLKELVVPSDDEHLNAFNADGTPVRTTNAAYAGLNWNGLPLCEDYKHELACVAWAKKHGGIAWATGDQLIGTTREENNCFMGTIAGVAAADLDNNGSIELAVTGMVNDASLVMRDDPDSFAGNARYFTTFLLNTDRGRYKNSARGYDWTEVPTDTGTPVIMDPNIIEYADSRPVTVDIDGDGNKEILYSACDGKVHCFSLDGTEHGAWPFSLTKRSSPVAEYATVPTCADVNGDGKQEVIFATYTRKDQLAQRGRLFILNANGVVLTQTTLPTKWGDGDTNPNGCRARPTVADVDGDGAYEIVLTSLYSGVMVYDMGA
ncbi:MAG: FG-GAP repeat domain-containing protein [Oscillospiraceae bacterium]|jgi:hypothetical protein